MDYVTFGRTGMSVSAVGLGTGGASKLGIGNGASERQAIEVIHRALELGITYFDTAKGYGTESIVGKGLRGSRENIVLSTKAYISRDDGSRLSAAQFRDEIEDSLQLLQTETIDVYHLHRLALAEYEYAMSEIVPVLERCRQEGKVRFFGVSESTSQDADHEALAKVARDGYFDVLMTGFNLFNQGSRKSVFPESIRNNLAVEIMGAARGPYSKPELLHSAVDNLINAGLLDRGSIDLDDPLGFLIGSDHAATLAEASYRLARYEPGVHVVLVGTGNVTHLEQNIFSMQRGPLPEDDLALIRERFGHLRVTRG
ncbi:MAG TPA: aldo/keto reductase [Acidimicrobiales bacterium]|nr:aldo/keto reductase [Acidimicrobiales bacterium]